MSKLLKRTLVAPLFGENVCELKQSHKEGLAVGVEFDFKLSGVVQLVEHEP